MTDEFDRKARAYDSASNFISVARDTYGQQAIKANEFGSQLAREEARVVVLGNFSAIAFAISHYASSPSDIDTLMFLSGVWLLLAGAILSVLALRFWSIASFHRSTASDKSLTQVVQEARISLGAADVQLVAASEITEARGREATWRGRAYRVMGASGAASVVGYVLLLRSVSAAFAI